MTHAQYTFKQTMLLLNYSINAWIDNVHYTLTLSMRLSIYCSASHNFFFYTSIFQIVLDYVSSL